VEISWEMEEGDEDEMSDEEEFSDEVRGEKGFACCWFGVFD
jgi:hypothetical protein